MPAEIIYLLRWWPPPQLDKCCSKYPFHGLTNIIPATLATILNEFTIRCTPNVLHSRILHVYFHDSSMPEVNLASLFFNYNFKGESCSTLAVRMPNAPAQSTTGSWSTNPSFPLLANETSLIRIPAAL